MGYDAISIEGTRSLFPHDRLLASVQELPIDLGTRMVRCAPLCEAFFPPRYTVGLAHKEDPRLPGANITTQTLVYL